MQTHAFMQIRAEENMENLGVVSFLGREEYIRILKRDPFEFCFDWTDFLNGTTLSICW